LELNQLYCFLTVARLEHMTKASEELHITQPALSRTIARLEEDIGVQLFDRDGKTIHLNEYGQTVRRYAQRIFGEIDNLRYHIDDLKGGNTGTIYIGSSFPGRERDWMVDCMAAYMLLNPNVSIHQYEYNIRDLRQALEAREIDLAISTSVIQSQTIQWEHLCLERLGIILSHNHPLAQKETISMNDLRNEHFYCNNANSDVQDLTRSLCEHARFIPSIQFEGEFPLLIGAAISQGRGVSIISERGFLASSHSRNRRDWEDKIMFRHLTEDYCVRDFGVAVLADRYLPTAVEDFYRCLMQCNASCDNVPLATSDEIVTTE